MAKDTSTNKDVTELLPTDVIRSLPLTDIFIDYDWNSRSKAEITEVNDAVLDTTLSGQHRPEGAKFQDFMFSFFERGQDTPVFVAPVVNGKSFRGVKTDKPYQLVVGFRRATAITRLNVPDAEVKIGEGEKVETLNFAKRAKEQNRTIVPNTANGTILAVVRELDPLAARLLNARENTQRKNYSTPDLLRLVLELRAAKMTQQQISAETGIDQGYISRLLRIGALPKDVIGHWAGDIKTLPGLVENTVYPQLTTKDLLELADTMKDKPDGVVTACYVQLLNPSPPAGGENAPPEDSKQVKELRETFFMIGRLVELGILESGTLAWHKVVGPKKAGFLIDSGTKVSESMELSKVLDIVQQSYEQGIDAGKKQPAGKPANGESATA